MATDNIIRSISRTFSEYKEDLYAYIKQAYPDIYKDFNDSSVGAMLVDINAGVANNLSINNDRLFQETQLNNAQQKSSILNIAKNMGFNIPPKRPSATAVLFTVTVPAYGDSPDSSYYPVLQIGSQVSGGGKIFETQDVVDWNSPYSSLGDTNRSIIPNYDNNGRIVSYNVGKLEVVVNGSSNIFRKTITQDDVVPFFSVILPDLDVIEIESIILKEGNVQNVDSSDFYNENYRYYEVDYLAQQKVFVENTNYTENSDNIKVGYWKDVTKKFIKEFTNNGYCKITFGSGDSDVNSFKEGFLKEGVSNRYFLENFLNNTALGEKLKANYTLFIKYRVGGGSSSNIPSNVLNSMGSFDLRVNGSRNDINQSVRRSLKVTNVIPAMGGNDGLSVEQIRQLISYNFSSQNRDVTLSDYINQVYKMPGKFGSPFRANCYKKNNKIVIPILDIGADGKLSNSSNSILKNNITEYLRNFRMVNDYIEVKDGKIINIAVDVDVYVENVSDNRIANSIINIVKDYFDIDNFEMNQDIYLGKLQRKILDANGVINIISMKIYNKVGGNYSLNTTSQAISNTTTGEIQIINNAVYSSEDSMFEIKYPEKDIRVFLRKNVYG